MALTQALPSETALTAQRMWQWPSSDSGQPLPDKRFIHFVSHFMCPVFGASACAPSAVKGNRVAFEKSRTVNTGSQAMQQANVASIRRQFERRVVKANAFVHCGGRFQRAKVVDCSQGGLQLEGTFGLMKRDSIQVELLSGTRVAGRVAWSLGAHTGVAFTEVLPADHPAMVELTRRTADQSPSRLR